MWTVRSSRRASPGSLIHGSEKTGAAVDTDALREVLGVHDLDPGLLQHALTHRSFAYENGNVPNNERLEFLGDSVLGLVVTDTLFTNHPDLPEGPITAQVRFAIGTPAEEPGLAFLGVGISFVVMPPEIRDRLAVFLEAGLG